MLSGPLAQLLWEHLLFLPLLLEFFASSSQVLYHFPFTKRRVSIIKVENFGNVIILGWSARICFEPHGPFLAGHTDSPLELGWVQWSHVLYAELVLTSRYGPCDASGRSGHTS